MPIEPNSWSTGGWPVHSDCNQSFSCVISHDVVDDEAAITDDDPGRGGLNEAVLGCNVADEATAGGCFETGAVVEARRVISDRALRAEPDPIEADATRSDIHNAAVRTDQAQSEWPGQCTSCNGPPLPLRYMDRR